MKKLLLMLLMPLAVLTAQAQSNDYNMVIELNNGTKITLGANDVKDLTFNGDALSISGNTINDILNRLSKLEERVFPPMEVITVNNVSFKMVKVEGGTFQMGSDEGESDELPIHSVTLDDYYIGETEVTQALWYAVMGQKPTSDGSSWSSSCGLGDDYPAYYISWNDCLEFITKLNELTGMQFRLPTEAEWEFAARGGNSSQGYKYAGSNTIDDVAWYISNSSYKSNPVGAKSPNELGLYDMSGNVWEWCEDWYGSYSSSSQTDPVGPSSGSYRVLRGGSWGNSAGDCRVSLRSNDSPSRRRLNDGLRLAL